MQALLDVQPDVTQAELYLLRAFDTLSTNRAVGFGALGPIPSLAVDDWLTRHGFDDDPELADDVRDIFRDMDRAWRRWHAKHPPKPATPTPPAQPPPGRRRFWGRQI